MIGRGDASGFIRCPIHHGPRLTGRELRKPIEQFAFLRDRGDEGGTSSRAPR